MERILIECFKVLVYIWEFVKFLMSIHVLVIKEFQLH